MTKKEAIAKAYGEHYPELKNSINVNGWCSWNIKKYFKEENTDSKVEKDKLIYRPKSLAGIENNNGWIKIESEADLPSEGWHWTLSIIENEPFQTHYEDINARYHTHYQPIVKPQPPIY